MAAKAEAFGNGRSANNPDMRTRSEKGSVGETSKWKMLGNTIWNVGAMMKHRRHGEELQKNCTATKGTDAPNSPLLDLDGTPVQLADLMKPGRPLVINFGSCS